jgi:hypothetical protein
MRSIRLFLWGLVAAMTLQGFLHADEYGSAASLVGGVTLTFSVWGEGIAAAARSLFQRTNTVGLPRALVQAALQESARHPGGLGHVPRLRQALQGHQHVWELFREREVDWMLHHADVVSGLMADPDGRLVWSPAFDRLAAANQRLEMAIVGRCSMTVMLPGCATAEEEWNAATAEQEAAAAVVDAWRPVLRMELPLGGVGAWLAITNITDTYTGFGYDRLYDVVDPADVRIRVIRDSHGAFTVAVTNQPWTRRLVNSLLEGELWLSCLEHVRAREGRVRELMIGAGVQELFRVHERILNASLRSLTAANERQLVYDWFGEMGSYAWWMSEEMPAIVRRCVAQEAGDCARIGPTEIAALRERADERARIVDDWSRRVLIGMWNALPALGLLILLEVLTLCLDRRMPMPQPPAQEIVLRLPEQRRSKRILLKNGGSGAACDVPLIGDGEA